MLCPFYMNMVKGRCDGYWRISVVVFKNLYFEKRHQTTKAVETEYLFICFIYLFHTILKVSLFCNIGTHIL